MSSGNPFLILEGQAPPSTSLIVRGNVIKDTDEAEVFGFNPAS